MARNYISNKDETVRMFESDFFEAFSKVHPVVPLIIYLPLISYLIYISCYDYKITTLNFILLSVLGIIVWTLTEYSLHRFIFHYTPSSKVGARIHFIFHGVHHDYPRDSRRLVMPPAVSIPLSIIFYNGFRYMLGHTYNMPFFAGFLTGYLFYDMMHFAVHHLSSQNRLFLFIKKHHMKHHYMDMSKGFGVSQPLWDIVYKTNFDKKDSQSSGI